MARVVQAQAKTLSLLMVRKKAGSLRARQQPHLPLPREEHVKLQLKRERSQEKHIHCNELVDLVVHRSPLLLMSASGIWSILTSRARQPHSKTIRCDKTFCSQILQVEGHLSTWKIVFVSFSFNPLTVASGVLPVCSTAQPWLPQLLLLVPGELGLLVLA